MILRDDKLRAVRHRAARRTRRSIKDHNIRIFAEEGQIHVLRSGKRLSDADPFALFERLLAEFSDHLDPSHAFYLGYEMCKARDGAHAEQRISAGRIAGLGIPDGRRGFSSAGAAEGLLIGDRQFSQSECRAVGAAGARAGAGSRSGGCVSPVAAAAALYVSRQCAARPAAGTIFICGRRSVRLLGGAGGRFGCAGIGRTTHAIPERGTIDGLPPFQGGAAGLFAYDLNRSLERIARPRADEFQVPALAIGLYDVVVALRSSDCSARGSCRRDCRSRTRHGGRGEPRHACAAFGEYLAGSPRSAEQPTAVPLTHCLPGRS